MNAKLQYYYGNIPWKPWKNGIPLELTHQDQVGGCASEGCSSSDACSIRNTNQKSFPHFHLVLCLSSDLFQIPLLWSVCPVRSVRLQRGQNLLVMTQTLIFKSMKGRSNMFSYENIYKPKNFNCNNGLQITITLILLLQ